MNSLKWYGPEKERAQNTAWKPRYDHLDRPTFGDAPANEGGEISRGGYYDPFIGS